MLSRFCSERYYTKQFDALLYLAALGLKVVHQAEGRNEIKVADGDENADPTTARSEAAAR